MTNKPTVTIGIPAYNEEANIGSLLEALLVQRRKDFLLEKILVYSDASTDKTENIVNKFTNKGVVLKVGKERRGVAYAQNEIIADCDSDILVILNADVLPRTDDFIARIIQPITSDKTVGLVSSKIVPAEPTNFFESTINFSHELKLSMERDLIKANKIHLCRGSGRAFSRKFYEKLKFPTIFAEDAYSYLACIKAGFSFSYQDKAILVYRSPQTFSDHLGQSTRFYKSKDELKRYFSSAFIGREYNIPRKILIKTAIGGFLKDPLRTVSYSIILAFSKFLIYGKVIKPNILWSHVQSSKKV